MGAMRKRLLEAAVGVVSEQGVSASTAVIAKRAGAAQGSVFHHFGTKDGLLEALFVDLKHELREAVLEDLDAELSVDDAMDAIWDRWMRWGTENAVRRRALLSIYNSDILSLPTRDLVADDLGSGVTVFLEASKHGPLAGQSIHFIGPLVAGVANSTMDSMLAFPAQAEEYKRVGYAALRSMLGMQRHA
jgi:AcrR family transcriptional regulator